MNESIHDIKDAWDKSNITIQARQLIAALKKFPKQIKIILIIRHSHREVPKDEKEIADIGLTPLGKEIAKNFGEKLPSDRPIRLFHSITNRCQETVENISVGFKRVSEKVEIGGPLEPLYDLGTSLDFHIKESLKFSGDQFIIRWVAGHYPSDIINPFINYCQDAAYTIWKHIFEAPRNCIDIHVTHDIFIMTLRLGWFGFPPTDKWPHFLGGLAFTFSKDKTLLFDLDNLVNVEFPYWWKTH